MTQKPNSRVFGIIVLLLLGFGTGVYVTAVGQQAGSSTTLSAAIASLKPQPKGADFQQLQDVWDRLHQQYVNANINDHNLLEGALTGLVSGLGDPYSTYLSADSAKKFEDELSGTFEGVGMQLGYKDKKIVVIAPLPKSPAEKAGLLAGDTIITVDKKDVSTMTLDDVVNTVRGKQGTSVTLTIQRAKEDTVRSFTLTREKIIVASVEGKVTEHNGKKIGEFTVNSFDKDTGHELRAKMNSLNATSLDSILIDVRNNPGGYLDQAVDVGSIFIQSGIIVSEVDRNGKHKNFDALGNATMADKKVVILVNGGSASASEIVAGALQDSGHGTIVGTQTFGKGSVQDYETLDDGSSLKLTVAKWFTPKGRSISDHGITPDVVVAAPTDATADSTLDPQRDKALDILSPATAS